MTTRVPIALVAVLALVWHLVGVLVPAWDGAQKARNGRDFASYYYAVVVARDGADPYDTQALNTQARSDQRRGRVHPFFYPPPFVAGTAWVAFLDLHSAYQLWFWLDELSALLAMVVLWRWWRPLHPVTPAVIAVLLALMTAVPNNHLMGQVNFPVLLLVLCGLYAEAERRPWVGGVLVGLACMAKMAPALFVMWWILRLRWRPVVAACVTAVGVSVVALIWVGPSVQWRFYTAVLPQFASGDYNGLTVPIQLFGNHSVPNVLDRLFPVQGNALSGTARAAGTLVTLGLLGTLGALFWKRDQTPWQNAGQASAVAITMLLIPVYTYEHHLIWALPAMVLAGVALFARKLPWPVGALAVLAIAVLCFDLQAMKAFAGTLDSGWGSTLVRESKMAGLLVLWSSSVWIGRRG